jgi:hypothetical protein
MKYASAFGMEGEIAVRCAVDHWMETIGERALKVLAKWDANTGDQRTRKSRKRPKAPVIEMKVPVPGSTAAPLPSGSRHWL